jgi:hypothetical protein
VARGRRLPLFAALALTSVIAGASARAQNPVDSTHHVIRIDASALRAGVFEYETTIEKDASTTSMRTRIVSVSSTNYVGTPAWLLLETRNGNGIPSSDSLITDMTGLHPIHWGAQLGRARLSAEFRGDTVYGGTSGPPGRRSIVATMAPSTIVSAAMLETVLRLIPLQTAWEDSASTLSVSLNGATMYPTRIAVIGEDRVRVPAGQYDCWVVSVRAGDAARGLYWVTKRDPMVVRSTLDVPVLGGAQLVNALVRVSR